MALWVARAIAVSLSSANGGADVGANRYVFFRIQLYAQTYECM